MSSRTGSGWPLAGVIVTVNSLLGLVLPLVIRGIIDSALVVANQQLLNRVTLLLIAIFVVQAFLGFGQIYLLSWVGERVVANLRKALYGHLQSPCRCASSRARGSGS